MILHVFNNQEKFSKGFFRMLHEYNFDLDNHCLFHYGKRNKYFSHLGLKTIFSRFWFTPMPHINLLYWLFSADKVIVHSLASPILLLYLMLFPQLCYKVNWVVWGKDLYFHKLLPRPNFTHNIYEFMRKSVFPRIPIIITAFQEEYNLCRNWYNVTGVNIECALLYPYSVSLEYNDCMVSEKKNEKLILLLGNSSSQTNNHLEALEKLKAYDKNIDKIYCPLSYGGNKVYAKNVCRTGERLFGAKFIALKEFMSADDYYRIIGNIDIAIFNHQRQEGLNNIYSLLSQAKTIYINSTITTWPFLIRKNIQVKDFLDIGNESLSKFDSRILENNRSKIRELVNIENTLGIWKKVFEV